MNKQTKKLTLSLDLEYSLFGIQTRAPSYKLVYFLNKGINIELKRDNDIHIIENNQTIYLSRYTYYDSCHEQEWALVNNESKVQSIDDADLSIFNKDSYYLSYLIPEYKMFNYILKIDGEFCNKEEILKMNNIKIINIASYINKSLIKNTEKLIF
tara:strand:+ start:462 stop:926 length:465 start_codon:yes stop_codon:yes gene_type:complete